ncbi:Nif3-like dinuclear metal center hexameric protein [Hippea alviniae]|uniref:Nif3-like dinuclear metal center hexameric protein n=1 Tax=Hippea alviniae TaxID=1279027 RepID=UPI0003B35DC2|nr:Nif3-like dinuclear metal center hexameric protein [Hippea alviniae]
MRVEEVVGYLEAYFPLSLQEGWDNSGLQVSPKDNSIKGILLALDITTGTIDEAVEFGCNLIIAHHPLIFSSTKKIFNHFYPFNVVYKAVENGIGIYAFHTNLDIAEGGLNDYLCDLLDLRDVQVLQEHKPLRVGVLDRDYTLDEFANFVKEKLGVDTLKVIEADDKPIRKVAVCSGSCMDLLNDIKELDFDLFLSGDLKHHIAIFAKETGINVIDATHFHTEKFSKEILFKLLKDKFENLRIFISKRDELPWKYL